MGAEADFGRQLDGFIVQGISAAGSSEWTRFNLNTDPVGARALETGLRFNNTTPGPITEITFSFADGGVPKTSTRVVPLNPTPSYLQIPETGCVNNNVVPGVESNSHVAFNQPQREAIRQILESIQSFANIEFREVAAFDQTEQAQVVLGSWDIDCNNQFPAYNYPTIAGTGFDFESDIFLAWDGDGTDWDGSLFDAAGNPTSVQGPGTSFNFEILQRFASVLGLGPAGGGVSLSVFNLFDYNSVTTDVHFNGNSQFDQAYPELPSTFQIYDIVELQRIYGARETFNPENNQYRFSDANQQAIYDTGGIDTINLTNSSVPLIIDLREGQRSTLQDRETGAAFDNSVLIPYGVVIENARGGSGDDNLGGNEIQNFLISNDGNDTLIGRGGNDTLRGGAGDDIYLWNLGDGRDIIVEEDNETRGIDRLHLSVPTGELDLAEDDFVASIVEGPAGSRDLRIDLTLNRGEAQGSVVIQDYQNVGNQVETLALFGPQGQVGGDIDLTSIFASSEVLPQRFTVTNQSSAFGFIAQPVA